MLKSVNFGIFLLTLSTVHVLCYDNDNIVPVQSTKELLDCIRDKVLQRSNYYRGIHKLEPFVYNEKMNNEAQKWANYIATFEVLKHKPTSYGENITIIRTMPNVGARIIDLWYSCLAYVNVNDEESELYGKENIGALTQLLWRTSREIGVGVAETKNLAYFILVVYYDPKGNVENFSKNLPEFKQDDINKGINELNFFDFSTTFISNSERGDYRRTVTAQKPESGLTQEFNSNPEPEGLSVAEASRIRNQVLKKLNVYRNKHQLSEFAICEDLNNTAQELANDLALKKITNNETRRGISCDTSPTLFRDVGEAAVDNWYNQISCTHENMKEEDFEDNVEIVALVHILWKASTAVGVGVAIDDKGCYNIVAQFDRIPNMGDSYLENLPTFERKDIDFGKEARKNYNALMRAETKYEWMYEEDLGQEVQFLGN